MSELRQALHDLVQVLNGRNYPDGLVEAVHAAEAALAQPQEAPASPSLEDVEKLRFIKRVLENFAGSTLEDRVSAHQAARDLFVRWHALKAAQPVPINIDHIPGTTGDALEDAMRWAAATPAPQEPAEAWREHVEQRLLTWRQSFMNKSGDQLALDDFMDKESLADLIDFVCDEYAGPPALSPADAQDARRPDVQELLAEFDAMWDHLIDLSAGPERPCFADMIALGGRRAEFKKKVRALAAMAGSPKDSA